MTLKRLRLRSLLYHWRGNLAVFLGVVVGTAVLTGALLVGDSLRGSLRERTLRQLEWVDEALIASRFFRQALADELSADAAAERICPVIMLQATAVGQATVRGVTVLGVDERFWSEPRLLGSGIEWNGDRESAALNSTLGRMLGVTTGGKISLRLQKPSAVPRETLLGRRDERDIVEEWMLPVAAVLRENQSGDRFNLRPELEVPRLVYVPLAALQKRLGLSGRCNAVLAGGVRESLTAKLRTHLRLADWGLTLQGPRERVEALFRPPDKDAKGKRRPRQWRDRLAASVVESIRSGRKSTLTRAEVEKFYSQHRNYLTLESRQLLIEPYLADAALQAAKDTGLQAAPTLVYLANSIAADGKEIPYSVVAALDPDLPPPLGPFLPAGVKRLADDEIVLTDWKESPLPRQAGENVTLRFFPPTHQGQPQERSETFRLAGFVPLQGIAADPDLTPEFPGITDQLKITEWEPPFPYDNSRIQQRDERYWHDYRTTPKAYLNLRVGQRLWGSRFGQLTSIRFAAAKGRDLSDSEAAFRRSLLDRLDPAKGGLIFRPVKEQALRATSGAGSRDFAVLLLGFSFFLIVASLLLVGLLFRLNIDRRADEIGLLLAVGYRRAAVRWLLLGEGCVLAGAGAVIGSCLAMLYARMILQLLAALWPGDALQTLLRPHYSPWSLILGAGGAFAVSVLTILWAVFSLGRMAPSSLLAGQMPGESERVGHRRRRWSWWIAGASTVCAVAALAFSGRVQDHEMRAMTFFSSGSLLLIAGLAALSGWMRSARQGTVEGPGWGSVGRLGIRNAARHPGRSLLTAGLLASAAFLIVAVEAFRRHVDAHSAVVESNGGFELIAESDLPFFRDLNTDEGRREVIDKLRPIFREEEGGDNARTEKKAEEAAESLKQTQFIAFRVRAGDDASCLNLYQPLRPRLIGVPLSFIERNYPGFRFAGTSAHTISERVNPWTLLLPASEELPAFGEKNTVEWVLQTHLGGRVALSAEKQARIDGLLSDSIFQSSLLVSEPNFLNLYPDHEGYNFMLIRPPEGKEQEIQRWLEHAFADRGLQITPTADRLNAYLAVENTYLSTFQALGGLGLILGSLGLAVVLLRGVWERRGELALLRALGFRHATLGWLILAENAFLLLVGLLIGTVAALVAVAPHLLSGAGEIPWLRLLVLLAGVVAAGLLAEIVATISTLRAPLLPALRRE